MFLFSFYLFCLLRFEFFLFFFTTTFACNLRLQYPNTKNCCSFFEFIQEKYGNNYDINILTDIIVELQNQDEQKTESNQNSSKIEENVDSETKTENNDENSNIPEFTQHLSFEECNNLKINDKIDHRYVIHEMHVIHVYILYLCTLIGVYLENLCMQQ